MSLIPTDDEEKGDGGTPQDGEDLGTAPTMLYMKPVSEDEQSKAAIDKAAEDLGGETLMMMPAISGASAADALSDEGTPEQGPGAGPLPEVEGLEELDAAPTMMYMPAVGGATDGDADSEGSSPGEGGFSDEVQKKLAELRGTIGADGDDAGSSTMAYMPTTGGLPVDQAVDKMMAETGKAPVQQASAPEKPRVATAPAFPAVELPEEDLGEASTEALPEGVGAVAPPSVSPSPKISSTPVVKPGPDLDDDEDMAALLGKGKGRGKKTLLFLFLLILLGAAGVTAAMVFDWMARPEFLDFLPHYELNL